MKALFLTLLLMYSCTKHAELRNDNQGSRIEGITMDLEHLNEIEWKVGKHKEKVISQSFTFIAHMPKMREEDLDYLTKEKKINSWILRLIVQRGSETQDLGSLYAKFEGNRHGRINTGGSPTSVSLKVYYAAAYASENFRMKRCPVFDHNKKMDGMKIVDDGPSTFDMTIGQSFPYPEKSQLVELNPSSFNGGNSLVGEYFVEIAPYDHENKMIMSKFVRIPQHIIIERETPVSITSCNGGDQT